MSSYVNLLLHTSSLFGYVLVIYDDWHFKILEDIHGARPLSRTEWGYWVKRTLLVIVIKKKTLTWGGVVENTLRNVDALFECPLTPLVFRPNVYSIESLERRYKIF